MPTCSGLFPWGALGEPAPAYQDKSPEVPPGDQRQRGVGGDRTQSKGVGRGTRCWGYESPVEPGSQGGGEETPFLRGFTHSPFQPLPSGPSAGRCHPGSERPASPILAHLASIGTDPCPSAPCCLACAVGSGTRVLPQRGPGADPPLLEGSRLSWAQSPSKRARPGGAETWVRGPHRRGFAGWWR